MPERNLKKTSSSTWDNPLPDIPVLESKRQFTDGHVYTAIVVGGGHAGIEAALSVARLGGSALLISMDLNKVGAMSCNPAIGGIAKGQLVKEIEALGGEMGKAIDATGIQFRQLNGKKGPAVRSSRAQADRHLYAAYMQDMVRKQDRLDLLDGMVTDLHLESGNLRGVRVRASQSTPEQAFFGETVILTPGTFLNGKIFIGDTCVHGGRRGEGAATGLTASLSNLGLRSTRLKTGTNPRLWNQTIDYQSLEEQPGDPNPTAFSFLRDFRLDPPKLEQRSCYITYTNPETHAVIEKKSREVGFV